MVQTMFQLTEALAKACKSSVVKLVRKSVAQYIVTAPRERSDEEDCQRVLAFVKQG